MNTQRLIDKLTSWPVTLTVCLLIVLGTLTVKLWPRTVPFDQCSDLYKQYANVEGIDASFIKDYKVNDTVFVDVTLLEATTDSAWQALCADFAISDFVETIIQTAPHVVFSRQVNRRDYTQVVIGDSPDAEILSVSCDTKTFAIFHIHDTTEIYAVLHHNYKKSVNQNGE